MAASGARWSGNLRAMTGGIQRMHLAVSVVVRMTSGSVEVVIVGRTVRLEVQRRFIEVRDEATPNPTIGTLTALADALGLELVPQRRKAG